MVGWAYDEGVEHMLSQAPGIGVANMIDPTLDAGTEFAEADFSCVVVDES